MQDTRQIILEYLQEHGHAVVDRLAEAVDLAPVTVRHHLKVLRQRGLVEVEPERLGRGRPRHVYRLSPNGAGSLCEDRYELLAGRILDLVKAQDKAAAEQLFANMAARIVAERRDALDAAPGEEARLDVVVDMLAREGFLARWEPDGVDYLLHEIACPYASISDRHSEVCCMDLALIRAAVDGEVTRERWRPEGDEACVFRICPSSDSS